MNNLSHHSRRTTLYGRLLRVSKDPRYQYPRSGNWIAAGQSDTEEAAAFGEHLRQVFTPHSFHPHNPVVSASLDVPLPHVPSHYPFCPAEVSAVIAHLNFHKAPGYDLISEKVLRELQPAAVALLTTLFNSILRHYFYPLLWKFSQIIMVPKPGNPSLEVASYRQLASSLFRPRSLRNSS